MTQEQLAQKLFVSRTAISKWESGRGYPNLDSLRAIAKVFSLTVDELLSQEERSAVEELPSVPTKACVDANAARIRSVSLKINAFLDIAILLFLFLPLFAQQCEAKIVTVPLLVCLEIPIWIRVLYLCLFGGIAILAIVEAGIGFFLSRKQVSLLRASSLGLHVLTTALLIANRQPDAAILSLGLLLVKLTAAGGLYPKKRGVKAT